MKKISIAVCIASFNRRERTLACLRRLYTAELPNEFSITVHLLDDGSSDGTAAAVVECFPTVRLHHGDGNFFWAGGMRVAYGAAMAERHDYYVWLNDDVEMFADSLIRAVQTERALHQAHGGDHIIVGAMCARDLSTTTYSGFVRSSRLLPWKFRRISPMPEAPVECDTLNGNFVLIPAGIAHKLGNIDRNFVQMHADLVLGITARRAGARIWVMAGYAGVCELNTTGRKNWRANGLRLAERLAMMEHPLGYPLKSSIAYSRHFGVWAPVMIAAPYIGLIRAMLESGKRTSS